MATKTLKSLPALRRVVRSPLDWAATAKAGLLVSLTDALLAAALLSRDELERLVIPRRTLDYRRAKGQRLSPEESDRLLRIVHAVTRADEVFGDDATAHTWLRRRNRALRGARPLDLLDTDGGAAAVDAVLGRIEYGVFS